MEDFDAWEAIQKLLIKLQYQPIGKKFDTGERQIICPICFCTSNEHHNSECELGNAIMMIGRMLYT